MSVYYNDNDPQKAAWLRELIAQGILAPGYVDDRPIQEVSPDDLEPYTRCHFFAGIGVWEYALRLAGWPRGLPVWTGSCPCQPFSDAGEKKGFDDPRHVWPAWFPIIRSARPRVVFGEQVASPDGLAWFDLVSADMEGEAYACGAVDTCAAGVGAPHRRQRLYFVAESDRTKRERDSRARARSGEAAGGWVHGQLAGRGDPCLLADTARENRSGRGIQRPGQGDSAVHGFPPEQRPERSGLFGGLAESQHAERRPEYAQHGIPHGWNGSGGRGHAGKLAHAEDRHQWGSGESGTGGGFKDRGRSASGELAESLHPERRAEHGPGEDGPHGAHGGREEAHGESGTCGEVCFMGNAEQRCEAGGLQEPDSRQHAPEWSEGGDDIAASSDSGGVAEPQGCDREIPILQRRSCQAGPEPRGGSGIGWPSPLNGFWRDADWIFCRDGKWRPVRPGSFPLVDGAPARVVRLRGYGDGIVAQQAAAFIAAYMSIRNIPPEY